MVVNCAPQSLCGTAIALHLLTAMPMAWANEASVAPEGGHGPAFACAWFGAQRLAAPNKNSPQRHEQVSHKGSETGTLQGSGMAHVHSS
jgi:hypothetical protein